MTDAFWSTPAAPSFPRGTRILYRNRHQPSGARADYPARPPRPGVVSDLEDHGEQGPRWRCELDDGLVVWATLSELESEPPAPTHETHEPTPHDEVPVPAELGCLDPDGEP